MLGGQQLVPFIDYMLINPTRCAGRSIHCPLVSRVDAPINFRKNRLMKTQNINNEMKSKYSGPNSLPTTWDGGGQWGLNLYFQLWRGRWTGERKLFAGDDCRATVQRGLRGLIKHNYIDTIIIRILIIQYCISIVCRPLRLRPTRKSILGGVARNGDLQTNKLLYVYENLCVCLSVCLCMYFHEYAYGCCDSAALKGVEWNVFYGNWLWFVLANKYD